MVKIIISKLIFHGYCGITAPERAVGCRISVNLEAQYNAAPAVEADSVELAVDYSLVAAKIVDIGRNSRFSLLETMAEKVADMLKSEFPAIDSFTLRVEKVLPPVEEIGGFAVEVTR